MKSTEYNIKLNHFKYNTWSKPILKGFKRNNTYLFRYYILFDEIKLGRFKSDIDISKLSSKKIFRSKYKTMLPMFKKRKNTTIKNRRYGKYGENEDQYI